MDIEFRVAFGRWRYTRAVTDFRLLVLKVMEQAGRAERGSPFAGHETVPAPWGDSFRLCGTDGLRERLCVFVGDHGLTMEL